MTEIDTELRGKSVCITGGTGTFGKMMVWWLLEHSDIRRLVIFSRDELKQSVMKEALCQHFGADFLKQKLRFFIGDVRDCERLCDAFQSIDIVIHAAALKQVDAIEYNPLEAVKTNVLGASNVIRASLHCHVSKIIALSTDKAANPGNLYGATKLCADKLFVSGNLMYHKKVKIAVVRYGNVFASRGSVIPIFLERIKNNLSISITDREMTRFSMDAIDAVMFVLSSLCMMHGGEIFVPKLPSYSLGQLVECIQKIYPDVKVEESGFRPGEKLHECMIPLNDSLLSLEYDSHYMVFFATPGLKDELSHHMKRGGIRASTRFEYSSDANIEWLSNAVLEEKIRKAAQDYQ